MVRVSTFWWALGSLLQYIDRYEKRTIQYILFSTHHSGVHADEVELRSGAGASRTAGSCSGTCWPAARTGRVGRAGRRRARRQARLEEVRERGEGRPRGRPAVRGLVLLGG